MYHRKAKEEYLETYKGYKLITRTYSILDNKYIYAIEEERPYLCVGGYFLSVEEAKKFIDKYIERKNWYEHRISSDK